MSAKETLAAAQSLYEQKKLLSYPRTDSRHLSTDVAATLPAVVAAIAAPYAGRLGPGTGERPSSKRFVDDAQVTDHHALLPTAVSPEGLSLSTAERRIYDLVCRRLLMAWHDEHVFSVTTVITRVDGARRRSRGRSLSLDGHGGRQWWAGRCSSPRRRGRRPQARGLGEPRRRKRRGCGPGLAPGSRRRSGGEGRRRRSGSPSARVRLGASPRPRCSRPWRRRAAPSTTASWPRP